MQRLEGSMFCELRGSKGPIQKPLVASYEQLISVSVIQGRPEEKFEVNCIRTLYELLPCVCNTMLSHSRAKVLSDKMT